jgi:hypothetical protein
MTIKKEQENQKDNKELTYKDCVWYMADIDRCKLPGINDRYMTCTSQEKGKMEEFCIWITEFMTSRPKEEVQDPSEIQLELFDLEDPFGFGSSSDLAPRSYMDAIFEKAYEGLKKWKEEKEPKEES